MRVSSQKINDILRNQINKTLSQVLTDIKDPEEMDKFLSDFLSESEYGILAKRLAIAYWLKKGRSYQNIKNNLKVSSATVASVQNEMSKEGYKKALKLMEADEWANVWAEKIKRFIK
jgi:uncharacterized protein YerC